jgi:hypothetical protein
MKAQRMMKVPNHQYMALYVSQFRVCGFSQVRITSIWLCMCLSSGSVGSPRSELSVYGSVCVSVPGLWVLPGPNYQYLALYVSQFRVCGFSHFSKR